MGTEGRRRARSRQFHVQWQLSMAATWEWSCSPPVELQNQWHKRRVRQSHISINLRAKGQWAQFQCNSSVQPRTISKLCVFALGDCSNGHLAPSYFALHKLIVVNNSSIESLEFCWLTPVWPKYFWQPCPRLSRNLMKQCGYRCIIGHSFGAVRWLIWTHKKYAIDSRLRGVFRFFWFKCDKIL